MLDGGGLGRVAPRILITLIILSPVAVLAFYPAQPPSGDRAEHHFSPINYKRELFDQISIGPLVPGTVLQQEFTARQDGLSRVTMRFGTFGGVTGCAILATLRDSGGRAVDRQEHPCVAVPDTALYDVLTIEPQAGSRAQRFRVEITMVPGSVDAIHAWGVLPSEGFPPASLGDQVWTIAAELHTGYGPSSTAWDQIGLAISRAGQYRPGWGRASWITGMILLATSLATALVWVPPKRRLAVLLALVAVKGVIWAVMLPPLEGPDEEAHYAYAQYIAEEGAVPDRDRAASGRSVYSEELVKAREALNVGRIPTGDRPDFSRGHTGPDEGDFSRGWSRDSPGNGPAAGYPPAYYGPSALLYLSAAESTLPVKVVTMRLWSVLLGVLAVSVTVRIASRIFKGEVAPLLLGFCVGMQPMFSQQMAVLNNDILVIFGSFLCLDVLVRLLRPGATDRTTLDAGLALGIATLGKPYGIAFAPVLGLGWLIGQRRREPSRWIRAGALASAGFLLTYGLWWTASKIWGFGGIPFPSSSSPGPRTLTAYLGRIIANDADWLSITWVNRFWGEFSWLDTRLPEAFYDLMRWGTVVGIVLMAGWAVLWGADRLRPPAGRLLKRPDRNLVIWGFILAILAMVGLLHAIEFAYFRKVARVELLQGRYALGILPALLALPALIVGQAARGRAELAVLWIMAFGMGALQLLALSVVVDRFYL